ncbi:hypothetical protein ACI8AV_13415 [Geodermatophilus sp. SYSU D00804]
MGVVLRGLRQALAAVLLAAAVALAVAGLWSLLGDGSFLSRFALVLLVLAGLIGLTSGAVFTRAHEYEHGRRPDVDDHGSPGGVLTGVGVFLFVSLPLFAAGAVLLTVA